MLTLACSPQANAQTPDKAQLDRRVAEYVWKAAYVLDTDGLPDAEARITDCALWLLCGEACPVTVPATRLAKTVAHF